MLKQRGKTKELILSAILIFSLLFAPVSNVQAAAAVTSDIQQAARNVWDKVSSVTMKALKTSVLSALLNVATLTTQKLAYDAAMYLSAGGSGQQSLFEPRGWKEYGQMLGEQALGEFVGSLSQSWSSLGLNICEPSPLQKLEFQKAFTKDINISVPKGGTNVEPVAKCNWSDIKNSYSKLAQSVEDFEIDMDIDVNFNLQQGDAMTLGDALTGTQQGLSNLSQQLGTLTEKMYAQGVDLTKLWTSTAYIKTLLNPSLQISSEVTKKVSIKDLPQEILKLVQPKSLLSEDVMPYDEEGIYNRIARSYSPEKAFPISSLSGDLKENIVRDVLVDPDLPQEVVDVLTNNTVSVDSKMRAIYSKYYLTYDVFTQVKNVVSDAFLKVLQNANTTELYAILEEYNTSTMAYSSLNSQDSLNLTDAIFKLRSDLYVLLNKKIEKLEKSLKGERKDDKTLATTLNEPQGDLYFWKEFRQEMDAAGKDDDKQQAVFDKYFLKEAYLNNLVRQQVWDRLLVMELIADKKIDEKVIKYVFYNDIDKYVKASGDGLSDFVSFLQPGNNPASVGTALSEQLTATSAEYAKKAEELANNKGFKAVTDIVSGRVKTPADVVAEQFKQTTIKDPSATKQTSLMGAYFNADVGMALLNVAVSTFTNTVFNNLMNKVYSGLFKPDQMIANEGVTAGLTQSQLAKKLSANINVQTVSVGTTMTDYNVLDEYAICPNEYATVNNCVLDNNFLQALQSNPPMTIAEAVEAGFLNEDWPLLPKNHPFNSDKDCYTKAFCYSNLQKLRHSRIISVGWELAADLCSDSKNAEYCTTVRGGILTDTTFTLKEALDNFYNCGQDVNHPYSILCNLIDPNWLLTLPLQKCQSWAYGSSVNEGNSLERIQYCADDVSCVSEDASGQCEAWGYCTKEKNIWRLEGGQACQPEEDSCRSFADSQGNSLALLKNTLLVDDFNTCNTENIGCAWYSKNKTYDSATSLWSWQDRSNDQGEALDRIYLTAQTATCTAADEGCSKLVRAMPRLGTNLLANSNFQTFVDKVPVPYFESWKTIKSSDLISKHQTGALLHVFENGGGLRLYEPLQILNKQQNRYFIYSVKLSVPQYLIDSESVYNFDATWKLALSAYKPGNSTPREDYIFDVFGDVETNPDTYLAEMMMADDGNGYADISLSVRFAVVPDVDRLSLGLVLSDGLSGTGNQVIIQNAQLEEVSSTEFSPSSFEDYGTENLVYLKKAPDYYQCYQNWHEYDQLECNDKGGVWNGINVCEAPYVCDKFAPYCSIDEVGCERFVNTRTLEEYNMVVSADDYCPAVCAGYEKLYELPTTFSSGRFTNLIADTANACNIGAVGCEEFTAIADDGSLENKYYFSYERTCQVSGADDCQVFYTWDNPGRTDNSIQSYVLKAKNNQPVVTDLLADQELCNEEVYNNGENPSCYKFYALKGGENIDLNDLDEDSAYISYHSIDQTVTCSNDCKPYRLTRRVTEDQCLLKGSDINTFTPISVGSAEGICTVYAILDENNSCSPGNVGCRAYRGSRSHSYFSLLDENFEETLDRDIFVGGERVAEAVQQNGYSWQNLGMPDLEIKLPNGVYEDNLYLLTFWARSATFRNDRLSVKLSGASDSFTGDEGIAIDTRWQQYVLGPVRIGTSSDEPILAFVGMNVGNLFVDNLEFREVYDDYYLIADSWAVNEVCDQIPDSNIKVPGYMLGCDSYQDSYGYKHYLKSFTSACREDAVGCELVLDTENNQEGVSITYNKSKNYREIGDLVTPVVSGEAACVTGGNIWERGHCHYSFASKPISQKQCVLWGYYWLSDGDAGTCVNDTIADDVKTSGDRLMTMVVNKDYLCTSAQNGCTAYGKAVSDANDQVMICTLDDVCSSAIGCACNHQETGEYMCTVEVGRDTCSFDTVYAINLPDQYEKTLCTANSKGCDQFTDSQNSTWYFRNPGNRVCEYQELRIEGQLKTGWFKKGTEEPCYENYKPLFGLWGADQSLDYYLAGIDDFKNYDGYVGSCPVTADMCTRFVDPSATTDGQRDYYYLDNGDLDGSVCNGQVNLAEGCILLNNTGNNQLTYSAERTYLENFKADYQPVGPQAGKNDESLNVLTGYNHPYYAIKNDIGTAIGFARVDLGDGIIQNYPYVIPFQLDEEGVNSNDDLLDDLQDYKSSAFDNIVVPGVFTNDYSTVRVKLNLGIFDLNITETPKAWDSYAELYKQVIAEMSKQGNVDQLVNNANTIMKVTRDRSCAEWLVPGDQEVVTDKNGKITNTTFSLLSCQKMSSGECVKLAPVTPPQYLENRLYALRGFGWNSLDYSGYSLPKRYSLGDYKQLDLETEDQLILGLDWKEQCNKDADCDMTGARCIEGYCYDTNAGSVKGGALSCRAYPEANSPFVYSLSNPLLEDPQVNRCYPMTGYCADQFAGTVKDYGKKCYSDLQCAPLQRCVFDNKATVDDCDCEYTKLTYADLGQSIYTSLEDEDLSSMGLCNGGLNDGLPCFGNNDCLGNQNRTMFRPQSTIKVFQEAANDGICVFPSSAEKKQGWQGFCLEKDSDGQCITWWPVNRLLGDQDIYYQDKTVGLPYLNRYYCLHEDTLYKRLLVWSPNGQNGGNEDLYSEAPLELYYQRLLQIMRISKSNIYTLNMADGDTGWSYLPFWPGALVNTVGKTITDWDVDADVNVSSGVVNGANLLKHIKDNWEGKSCFYMMIDVLKNYPQVFYNVDSNTNQPLRVSCLVNDNPGDGGIATYPINLYGSFNDIVSSIQSTFVNHNNRCIVDFTAYRGDGGDGYFKKLKKLFGTVCEYRNILEKDYPLLFQYYKSEDKTWTLDGIGDYLDTKGTKFFTAVNVGGTEKVCDLMAEVRDDEGNHYAYTNNFSKSSDFSFLRMTGKDYNINVDEIDPIYITDDSPWVGDSNEYGVLGKRIPRYGSQADTDVTGLFSGIFDIFQTTPLIVPRTIVKAKVNLYQQPQPFGAILGNNLYQPYVVPSEGLNMVNGLYLEYPDMVWLDGTPIPSSVSPCQNDRDTCLTKYIQCWNSVGERVLCGDRLQSNRTSAKLSTGDSRLIQSDLILQNKLFLLFNKVYNLLEYKVDLTPRRDGSVSQLFANKVMATYKDRNESVTNTETVYVRYDDQVLCMNYLPKSGLYEGVLPTVADASPFTSSAYVGTKFFGARGRQSAYCKGTYDVKFTDTPGYVAQNQPVENLAISKPKVSVATTYDVRDNGMVNLEFYGFADKNALPIRKVDITWGDDKVTEVTGFIANHQSSCDPEESIAGTPVLSEEDLSYAKQWRSNDDLFKADSYGSCSPICINWPVDATGKDVKGKICYDTPLAELVEILGLPSNTVLMPPRQEGIVAGELYKQSVRCYIDGWKNEEDDLCVPYFDVKTGRYIDSICESDEARKAVFNAKEFMVRNLDNTISPCLDANTCDFMRGFNERFKLQTTLSTWGNFPFWNSRLVSSGSNSYDTTLKDPVDDWLQVYRFKVDNEISVYKINDSYLQGAAGERGNCVEQKFSFKHWYQNIVDSNGKCRLGTGLLADRFNVAGENDDVIYCRLDGRVAITDNMGRVGYSIFYVYVATGKTAFNEWPIKNNYTLILPDSSLRIGGSNLLGGTPVSRYGIDSATAPFAVGVKQKTISSDLFPLVNADFGLYDRNNNLVASSSDDTPNVAGVFQYSIDPADLDSNMLYTLRVKLRFESGGIPNMIVESNNLRMFEIVKE